MIPLRQPPLNLPHRTDYSAATFTQGPCNQAAWTLVEQWPNWSSPFACIYGEPGCGKTHLAHIWQEQSQAVFLTPPRALEFSPRDLATSAQAFVLDDGEEILDETWLFDFYNILKEINASFLICSQQPPARWPVKLPDLHSRLSTIVAVEVTPPDDHTLEGVILKDFNDRGIEASAEVIRYILRHAARSFGEIHQLVETLDIHALSQQRALTIPLVREILEGNPMDNSLNF